MCQYGDPWKKPTSLLCGFMDTNDVQGLALKCAAKGKVCSRSKSEHVALEGSHMTKKAQVYSKGFAKALARAFHLTTVAKSYNNAA